MSSMARWAAHVSGTGRGGNGSCSYTVGWDRLRAYEDLVLRRLASDRLSSVTLYAEDGFWNTELELLERRGNVTLIISNEGPPAYVPRDPRSSLAIKRYCPAQRVHLHVKVDVFESTATAAFRLTTAHLASRRLGPIVLGMRGLGRTELFFLTDHAEIVAEGRALVAELSADRLPASGRYLRLETPAEDGIYSSLCDDIARLRPGTGRISHYRTSYYGAMWKPARQTIAGLHALHAAIADHARGGTRTLVAYGELNRAALAALKRHTDAGGRAGIPRHLPGSFLVPYACLRMLQRIPAMRQFKLAEHVNVTVIEGIQDQTAGAPYSIVYIGHKSDTPYDRDTLELMVRCDSREFPGLDAGLLRLLGSRFSECSGVAFDRFHDRMSAKVA
jgi:hypothetical protein